MTLPTLYKYTSKGQVQQWQIVVCNNGYYTVEGIQGGKLTESDLTRVKPKNIGRSNETTMTEQAILESKAKWQKKLDSGYNEVLTKEKKFFEPMLAFELKKYEKLMFTVPTFVQPKLDGVRCILKEGKLSTRTGNAIVSCPHLEIDGFFLDGELYSHELKHDFNKIISLTRKTVPEPEDFIESAKLVQYWVYDWPSLDDVFSERYKQLRFHLKGDERFVVVPTYPIYDVDDLQKYHQQFLEQGFEGSIVRMDLGPYECKRSKQLLKYKDFMDAEFKILDITPGLGNRSEVAGRLVCELPDGRTFGCSMTGDLEFMGKVLQDKDQIIGKEATVKFFQYTSDGVPRFPTLKNIIGYPV